MSLLTKKLNDESVACAVAAIARVFGVTAGQLLAHRRTLPLSEARHALCRLLREETDGTFNEIGRRLHRDHGSIMNGVQRAETLAEIDRHYAAQYEAARAAFRTAGTSYHAIRRPAGRAPWPWL